ncbi:MAG: PKD domain-containing protein [Acidobacteriota bacterium]|nr:PKD domain-containing protein [Acidobacteriota bacterium]
MRQYARAGLIVFAAALVPSSAHAGQGTQETRVPATRAEQPAQDPQQPPVDLLWRTEAAEPARLFSVVGLRLGVDQGGDVTWAGRGRFFAPFGQRSALQVEGSYDWYQDRHEGQIDVALVNRVRHVQLGLFSSARYVNLEAFDPGRWLSQFGGAFDYLFDGGRVGVFGTAGLRDTATVDRRLVKRNVYEETALRLVDQFGASWQVDVSGRFEVDGHMAVLRSAGADTTTGGSLRLVYPMSEGWAVTAEGAWNQSLVGPTTQGRFMVGVRMGEWPRARESSPTSRPVPIEIPAVRYQMLTRQVRDGNDAPFADAGPDQVISPECPTGGACLVEVKVDAYGSFDPDGDPITYLWTPRSGFAQGQSPQPPKDSWAMFQGQEGRTYVIRLQVTDDRGATAFDDVTVTILRRRH